MDIKTSVWASEDQVLIDMYVVAEPDADARFMARAVWPDDPVLRPAVVAELLKTLAHAVKAGTIPVEDYHVHTTQTSHPCA